MLNGTKTAFAEIPTSYGAVTYLVNYTLVNIPTRVFVIHYTMRADGRNIENLIGFVRMVNYIRSCIFFFIGRYVRYVRRRTPRG